MLNYIFILLQLTSISEILDNNIFLPLSSSNSVIGMASLMAETEIISTNSLELLGEVNSMTTVEHHLKMKRTDPDTTTYIFNKDGYVIRKIPGDTSPGACHSITIYHYKEGNLGRIEVAFNNCTRGSSYQYYYSDNGFLSKAVSFYPRTEIRNETSVTYDKSDTLIHITMTSNDARQGTFLYYDSMKVHLNKDGNISMEEFFVNGHRHKYQVYVYNKDSRLSSYEEYTSGGWKTIIISYLENGLIEKKIENSVMHISRGTVYTNTVHHYRYNDNDSLIAVEITRSHTEPFFKSTDPYSILRSDADEVDKIKIIAPEFIYDRCGNWIRKETESRIIERLINYKSGCL